MRTTPTPGLAEQEPRSGRRVAGVLIGLLCIVGVGRWSPVSRDAHNLGFLAVAPVSSDSAPSLETVADTSPVTVGDPVAVVLRVALPSAEFIVDSVPQVHDSVPQGVRVLSLARFRAKHTNRIEAVASVAFFRPGTVHLPVFTVRYRSHDGTVADSLRSAPIALTVISVLPEQSGSLRDIKALARGPLPVVERIAAALLAIVVLATAGAAWRAKRPGREAAPETVVQAGSLPARDEAYNRALAALAIIERDWLAHGDVVMHHELTADVIRRYLAEAHRVPALERTTPELLTLLPDVPLPSPHDPDVRALLERADLVKFAGLRPGGTSAREFLERSRALILGWHNGAPR